MDQDKKRELRQLKREIKRKGGKVRRHQLKQSLVDNPEEAHTVEPSFGRFASAPMNGIDRQPERPAPPPVAEADLDTDPAAESNPL